MSYLKNITKSFAVLVAAPVVVSTLAIANPVNVVADSNYDTPFMGRISSFSAQALVVEKGKDTIITLEILDQQLNYDGELVAELRGGEPGSPYINENNNGTDQPGEFIKLFTKKSSNKYEAIINSDDADDLFKFTANDFENDLKNDPELADGIHINIYVNDIDELEDAEKDNNTCDFNSPSLLSDKNILDFAFDTNDKCGKVLDKIRLASGGFVKADRDELPNDVDYESRIFGTSALGYDTNGLKVTDGLNKVREDKIEINESGKDVIIKITADFDEQRFNRLVSKEVLELRVGYLDSAKDRKDIRSGVKAGDIGTLVKRLEPFNSDGISETVLKDTRFSDIQGTDADDKHTIFVFREGVDPSNVDKDTDFDDVIYQYQINDGYTGAETPEEGVFKDENSTSKRILAKPTVEYTFEAMGVATFRDTGGEITIDLKNKDGLLFLDDIRLDLNGDKDTLDAGETAFQVADLKTFGAGASTFRLGTFQEGPDDEDVLGEINEVEIDDRDLDFKKLQNADLRVYISPNLTNNIDPTTDFVKDKYGNRVQKDIFNNTTDMLISLTVVGQDKPVTGTGPTTFSDVPANSTFATFITNLAKDGIVSGFSDGTFKPNNSITRGELAKIVKNALFGTTFVDTSCTGFSDITPSTAFYSEITTLKCQNVVSGFSDGTYKLSNNASRGEATKIVIGAAEKAKKNTNLFPINNTLANFADVASDNTFYSFIMKAYSNEIVSGTGNNMFMPDATITRGEMSKIVDNTRKM